MKTNPNDQLDVGVIGVGSMGQHHVRVYNELRDVHLVGVADADRERAAEIADEYGTTALSQTDLLERVDAVSIVVPTQYHFDLVEEALAAEVAPFVEKPVLGTLERAEDLTRLVDRTDLPVQVGHIERFNPAVMALSKLIDDFDVHSIQAQRLGPAPERTIDDSAVMDLMIHDIDIVCSLLGQSPRDAYGTGVDGNRHASAVLSFDDETMATLIASRKTQRKVRSLEITAEDCFIELDYLDQSIEIYRNSAPEYVKDNGGVRFTHESIVERPSVNTSEPLREELASFCQVVRDGGVPEVTVQDGIEALAVAQSIEESARGADKEPSRPGQEVFVSND
ncbi:oxidoreductase domain-containing protein [Halovivax asiaticus JCM 14624]|uniref:Oxidoreductase domain-containing protein n=1 Tax=Halovivax asiaticus JCM 14624 TaxID=1227490 RepID=M0BJU3_9EURY|nr:Gfo/Idh/MocA family oxidoreductase [Halovivax asiaticus]ELZ11161.1 oxidoreductase domain-containing protein [Halovivax asiaticus JCM 14624]